MKPQIKIHLKKGKTPLHTAYLYPDTATYLISNGANINAVDNDGFTPSLTALRNGQVRTFMALAKAGARLDITGKHGNMKVSFIMPLFTDRSLL